MLLPLFYAVAELGENPQLVPQPSISFISSNSPDLAGFRVYYKPGPVPVPEPFSYSDPYFYVPRVPGEPVVATQYNVQLRVEAPGHQGVMRISVVEQDQIGNLSAFSPEIPVYLDFVVPLGVTNLQLIPV